MGIKVPRVSVIMPVYNAEKYVKEAVYSILFQTYADFELILIDDASTDSSLKVIENIKDDRIIILRNSENKGISFSTNRGLDIARGEFIALLDDDDIAIKDRLWRSVCYLEEHPDIDVLGGNYKIMRDGVLNDSQYHSLHNPLYIKASLFFNCELRNGSCMYRKQFIDKYNIRYEDNFLGMQDYRFWTKCAAFGANMTILDDVFFIQRIHADRETTRVISKRLEERKNKYREIQEWAFRESGFKLSETDMDNICRYTGEQPERIENISEVNALYDVLNKIVQQAEENHMDNLQEIKIKCRKILEQEIGANPKVNWRD